MKWDESKHPRDSRGRFALIRQFYSVSKAEYIYNTDLKSSPPKPKKYSSIYDDQAVICPPKEAYGFLNKERLNTNHHIRHSKELGYKNQTYYERGAVEFWNSQNGTVYYMSMHKNFALYDGKKYVTVSLEGIVQTFMLMTDKEFQKTLKQEKGYEWINT